MLWNNAMGVSEYLKLFLNLNFTWVQHCFESQRNGLIKHLPAHRATIGICEQIERNCRFFTEPTGAKNDSLQWTVQRKDSRILNFNVAILNSFSKSRSRHHYLSLQNCEIVNSNDLLFLHRAFKSKYLI